MGRIKWDGLCRLYLEGVTNNEEVNNFNYVSERGDDGSDYFAAKWIAVKG